MIDDDRQGVAAAALVAGDRARRRAALRAAARRTQYDLLFQNAGQLVKDDDVQVGGRRIGSIREIKLTDDNRARVRVEVEEPYAPLREGTQRRDPPDLAVGHRQPLHRADAGAQLGQGARRRRDARRPARPPTSSTSTSSSTRSTRRRARTCRASSRASPTQYEGKGAAGRPGGRVLQPVPVDLAPARQPARPQDEGTLTDFIVNSSRAVTARRRAPRRPRRRSSATRTRRRRAIARRERRARAGARPAADHAAARATRRS